MLYRTTRAGCIELTAIVPLTSGLNVEERIAVCWCQKLALGDEVNVVLDVRQILPRDWLVGEWMLSQKYSTKGPDTELDNLPQLRTLHNPLKRPGIRLLASHSVSRVSQPR